MGRREVDGRITRKLIVQLAWSMQFRSRESLPRIGGRQELTFKTPLTSSTLWHTVPTFIHITYIHIYTRKKKRLVLGSLLLLLLLFKDKIATGKRKHEDDEPVFEQIENTANPSRCPVKMFECYLSKR